MREIKFRGKVMVPETEVPYIFNFPETKFARENTFEEQLEHIASEVEELHKEKGWREQIAETLDIIHSAETMLRVLLRHVTSLQAWSPVVDEEILGHYKSVIIRKNHQRGYYIE